MFSATVITFASLLAAVFGLQITEPSFNSSLDFSKTNTITWSSVATDQSSFQIVLVDNSHSPPTSTKIADSVNTSDGKYSFTNFVADTGTSYQIDFVGASNSNAGILAQSQTFTVSKSGVAPSSTSSSTASATGSQAAATSAHQNDAAVAGKGFVCTAPILAILYLLV